MVNMFKGKDARDLKLSWTDDRMIELEDLLSSTMKAMNDMHGTESQEKDEITKAETCKLETRKCKFIKASMEALLSPKRMKEKRGG